MRAAHFRGHRSPLERVRNQPKRFMADEKKTTRAREKKSSKMRERERGRENKIEPLIASSCTDKLITRSSFVLAAGSLFFFRRSQAIDFHRIDQSDASGQGRLSGVVLVGRSLIPACPTAFHGVPPLTDTEQLNSPQCRLSPDLNCGAISIFPIFIVCFYLHSSRRISIDVGFDAIREINS